MIEDSSESRRFYADRASARTPEDRLAHFEQWWITNGQKYEAAVIADGSEPWTDSMDERLAVWMRRYERPAPPNLPLIRSVRDQHRQANPTTDERSYAA